DAAGDRTDRGVTHDLPAVDPAGVDQLGAGGDPSADHGVGDGPAGGARGDPAEQRRAEPPADGRGDASADDAGGSAAQAGEGPGARRLGAVAPVFDVALGVVLGDIDQCGGADHAGDGAGAGGDGSAGDAGADGDGDRGDLDDDVLVFGDPVAGLASGVLDLVD